MILLASKFNIIKAANKKIKNILEGKVSIRMWGKNQYLQDEITINMT